jgi:3-deoxy-D-manno-octulosonic-acid transferase
MEAGGATSVSEASQLKFKLDELFGNPVQLEKVGTDANNYVQQNAGATKKILQFIQENRLLTR